MQLGLTARLPRPCHKSLGVASLAPE
jgi:hypothetical protein